LQQDNIAMVESMSISTRIRRAKDEIAKAGRIAGGGPRRFGFEPDGKTHRPAEAELVREAAQRILSGDGINTVVKDWNRRGIRMPGGSEWQATPLRRILLSPRVAGLRQHRGEVLHTAEWQPVIDRRAWEYLRAVLLDPARRKGGRPTTYMLRNLLWCSCGSRMYGRVKDGRPVYTCKSKKLAGCGQRIDGRQLDTLISERVIDWLAGPGLAQATAARAEATTRALMAEIDGDEQALEELARLHGENRIRLNEWLAAREPIEQRLETNRAKLDATPKVAALANLPHSDAKLRAWWNAPARTMAQHRAVLGAVLERIEIMPAVVGRTFDERRVSVQWRRF
jgi:hypothetical protein